MLIAVTAALLGTRGLTAQGTVPPEVRAALQERAGSVYPLESVTIVPGDSAIIEFADPTYTGAGAKAGTWMFGPPVPAIEQDSCPPPKIFGRKIARVLWQNSGKDARLTQIIVRVHGAVGVDRFSYTEMYYEPRQLDGPWAGDSTSPPARRLP